MIEGRNYSQDRYNNSSTTSKRWGIELVNIIQGDVNDKNNNPCLWLY